MSGKQGRDLENVWFKRTFTVDRRVYVEVMHPHHSLCRIVKRGEPCAETFEARHHGSRIRLQIVKRLPPLPARRESLAETLKRLAEEQAKRQADFEARRKKIQDFLDP